MIMILYHKIRQYSFTIIKPETMHILDHLKPFMGYMTIRITELRDTTLLSAWFSIPITLTANIIKWANADANIDYVRIVLTAIAIDHILGTLAHSRYFKNDFSLLKNLGGMGIKILVVVSMGSLFDGLATLAISQDFMYRYLFFVTRILIFLYPAMSAMKNCKIITRGAFPPDIILKKSDKVFNSLDMNVFKKPENIKQQDE